MYGVHVNPLKEICFLFFGRIRKQGKREEMASCNQNALKVFAEGT